eukprot:scaffold72776_cov69-Phaeocystis_antarctica.AAC.3
MSCDSVVVPVPAGARLTHILTALLQCTPGGSALLFRTSRWSHDPTAAGSSDRRAAGQIMLSALAVSAPAEERWWYWPSMGTV